jgi:Ankyrin repeats (3 copies)
VALLVVRDSDAKGPSGVARFFKRVRVTKEFSMLARTSHFPRAIDAKEAQPYGRDNAVSYDKAIDDPPTVGGSLAALAKFEGSKRGKALQQQYRTGIEEMKNFLRRNGSTSSVHTRQLSTFGQRIRAGREGYFSSEVALLYGEGKRSFDHVLAAIKDERIPVTTRMERLRNLAEGVTVCADGTLSNLLMAAEIVKHDTEGVAGTAAKQWEARLEQGIRGFVAEHYSRKRHYASNEIHYVNAFRNFFAEKYGLESRVDRFAPPHLDPKMLGKCGEKLDHLMKMSKVVMDVGEACLAEIHQTFAQYRHRALSEGEAFEIYRAYGNGVGAVIQSRYGTIDPSLIVRPEPNNREDETTYRLVEEPTLLARQVAVNLSKAGAIKPFKPRVVARSNDQRTTLERIDDIFYFRTTHVGGGGEPSIAASDDKSTLSGPLEDHKMLSRFPREAVWTAIRAGLSLSQAIKVFATHPEVRRYRAIGANDESLIESLTQAVVSAQPQSWEVTAIIMSALRNREDRLSSRLIEHYPGRASAAVASADGLTTESLLHFAARCGMAGSTKKLVEQMERMEQMGYGGSMMPNSEHFTPVMLAVREGNPETIDCLLRALIVGVWRSLNGMPGDGRNQRKRAESEFLQIMLGLDPRQQQVERGPEKLTLFGIAASRGHVPAMEVLQEYVVMPLHSANAGAGERLPLHLAAGSGKTEAARWLLSQGADVNIACADGSPLSLAVKSGKKDLVELLLNHGAKVDKKIMAYAKKQRMNEVYQILSAANTGKGNTSLFKRVLGRKD